MCVIIYIPKGETITKEELKKAWNRNSDGAGYALIKSGKVEYARGYMKFKKYYKAIKPFIGKYDLVLHFRISTSSKVNKIQTHPYEVGKKRRLYGRTINPVVCMNGVISEQTTYKGYNDTMSYIQDHSETFNILASHQSLHILDLIEEDTGSRWAVITPQGVLLSKGFEYENGKYYSNKNHLTRSLWVNYCTVKERSTAPSIKSLCKTEELYKKICEDKPLYYTLKDIVDIWKDYPYILDNIFNTDDIEELEATAYQYY